MNKSKSTSKKRTAPRRCAVSQGSPAGNGLASAEQILDLYWLQCHRRTILDSLASVDKRITCLKDCISIARAARQQENNKDDQRP
jgi:hypothetical protein